MIDTDQSDHPNFNVPQLEGGRPLDPHEMVERVAVRLRELIAPEDLAFYQNRILFAICVREIECWLLPLWDETKADKCEGCMYAVNRALGKAGVATLNTAPKDSRRYDHASRGYLKRQILLSRGPLSPSLAVFLDKLKSGNFVLSSE